MKKLILVLMLAAAAGQASAEKVYLTESKDGEIKMSMYSEGLNVIDLEKINVWVSLDYKSTGKNQRLNVTYDCSNFSQYISVETTYNQDGTVLKTQKAPTNEFTRITPDTLGSSAHEIACGVLEGWVKEVEEEVDAEKVYY